VIPQYAKPGDAGMDVIATSIDVTNDYIEYGTGLAFEVPEGYCMLILPRSSNSKKDLLLANSVGLLDSGYRGELKLRFKRSYLVQDYDNDGIYSTVNRLYANGARSFILTSDKIYDIGDKIGQIMIVPYPQVQFNEVNELSRTERADGGFGSTGI
jgi:dUTP pyrophosphatase